LFMIVVFTAHLPCHFEPLKIFDTAMSTPILSGDVSDP